MTTKPGRNHAIVMGGSMAGLLAGGRQVLDKLFPGISEELISGGAVSGDIVGKGRWFNEGACHKQFTSGLDGILMSRPFLEGRVGNRVLRLPKIQLRENCTVEGLAASADNLRVTGIKVAGEALPADLIVDATGRGSHSPQWLESVDYQKPLEDATDLAKRFFARAAKVVDIPWSIAVGNDRRMPEAVDPRNAGVKFVNWYMAKLHQAAHHDEIPAMAFHRVANLLATPPTVMRPSVAWRVLWGNMRSRPAERVTDSSFHAAAGQ